MLKITIPENEMYDESTNEFIPIKAQTLTLEHSLVSISKWEAKWKKPFLKKDNKTIEESIDYIRCMTLTQNVDPAVYRFITTDIVEQVNNYIDDSMTATTIAKDDKKPPNRRIITSELIYCWMFALNIPMECQKWHLNRLLMLINVCNIENQPPKKMNKREAMARNKSLNAARRHQLNTRG